jgi:hypothetical protein
MMNNQREFPRLRICLWNFGKASWRKREIATDVVHVQQNMDCILD